MAHTHSWHFSTVGGVKRVNIESAGDLTHLAELDPKLWTALSCPIKGLEIDTKTLELVDTDNDGQIHVPEVIAAVNWIVSVLKDPADIIKQTSTFRISSINTDTEHGRLLSESAKVILGTLGKSEDDGLTVEDTSDTTKIFANTRFNGDGIIADDATDDAAIKQLISEIGKCIGTVKDRSGKDGIDEGIVTRFYEACTQYATWRQQQEQAADTITPLGDATGAAHAAYTAIKSKVDDYFIRCRLAAFDVQATNALNLQVARVETITGRDLSQAMDEIAQYPLAKIEAGKTLPLTIGINPAWESQISAFRTLVAEKKFGTGHNELSEQEWNSLAGYFKPYVDWMAAKAGAMVEPLGMDRVTAIMAESGRERIAELIAADKAVSKEADNILAVNRLVRYHRDLYTLLKNFVTFFDFYSPEEKAIFQAGTLYIDQRSCDLCIEVNDMARQNALSSYSGMYLIYCNCISRATGDKMTIVAALTNGDTDNMVVGRNALFFDRKGQDWDATIVKIVDNPISIRQAFFSPYRKAAALIESTINKMASSQNDKVMADMNSNITSMPAKADAPKDDKKAPEQPFDVGKFVGIFAAIGLALGAIGGVLASFVGGFLKLTWWKMPIAIVGLLLVISGPAMILAWLKLRKRNLAPLLDANGWAINANVLINIQFGKTLTHLAELPNGARISFNDPFRKKKQPILPALFLFVVLTGVAMYLLIKHNIINLHLW